MNIEYYIKNVYGIDRIYIKDQKVAEIIARITGRKTLEQIHLNYFKELGINFVEIIPPKA